MENLESRLQRLEVENKSLRADLAKLAKAHLRRNESCHEVATLVGDFLEDYKKHHHGIWEQFELIWDKLRPAFEAVFPKHHRYLNEIDRALSKARKHRG